MLTPDSSPRARGYVLLSGGLDSQLAVCVLREAGAYVEGVCFETPFFGAERARAAAAALDLKLHVIDFTADEVSLLKNPPHGFGGAMNPCIDCHALMIRRAGEMMAANSFDFVATGEVLNQRPMSQNAQSLATVAKSSGLEGRLVRPLSAKRLAPTIPETEGLLAREKLLDLEGRRRESQFALAEKFGLKDYPSPAGGCKLTEEGFAVRIRDLLNHEGLDDLRLVRLLTAGRRFRLADGTGVILGRNAEENARLEREASPGELLAAPVNASGPTALATTWTQESLLDICRIVAAWSRHGEAPVKVEILSAGPSGETTIEGPFDREKFKCFQIF